MTLHMVMLWIHILTMVIVLGGYVFLAFFLWPVLRAKSIDERTQVHVLGQTLRRFFTTVVMALTFQIMTGGLYLLPPAYRAFQAGDEAALAHFHLLLIIKLTATFFVLILVPMQLFGMAFRLTRMDAGIYPYDPQVVSRVSQRMQTVSYVIIVLLTVIVLLSTRL
jgi:uncharacterized membrane protein